ncbi:hypothetical protein GCM10023093_16760 [Nemorincola caseinilytica]|uniref:Solute:sodium symporter small subunit n=1 Tax=Nemorincola caseinilytica TaxID=2054315 RepID=A0ABP8NCP2_9BACT
MPLLKEFFNRRVLVNCLVFALPLSLLFMWRFTHLRGIPFASAAAGKIYLAFVVVNYIILLLVFFTLYWLSRRRQQMDE